MAKDTSIEMRNLIIYSIFIRNHTPQGSFAAIVPDLPRIRALGADIVWLMPIHPVGVIGRKGALGCPYAVRDPRTVNPEYGSMEDFRALVAAIHENGMKCIIDVVYNHSSPDAALAEEHPEFYYRREDGSLGSKTGDWTDVADLDYSVSALWDWQIETLKQWAGIVDGFRCDVASCVPVEFWRRARAQVEKVRPGCIWLAETVHRSFLAGKRLLGQYAAGDGELFSAFDMEYEYDIREIFDAYIAGKAPLSSWLDALALQDCAYPDNYVKLRFLENHDQPRAASFAGDERALRNYTALLFFLKGATLLYAGQEFECAHLPSLFERDVIRRDTGRDLTGYLQRLAEIKKTALSAADCFTAQADDRRDIAVLLRGDGARRKLGIFSLRGLEGDVRAELPDGNYVNLIDGEAVRISGGRVRCGGEPIIISE